MDKKILRNYLWSIIKTFSSIIYPLITVPYVSRILSLNGIGTINFSQAVVDFFIIFASIGIPSYAVREGGKFRNSQSEFSEFASCMLRYMILTSFFCFIVYQILVLSLDYSLSDKIIWWILGLSILGNFLDVSFVFSVYEDFKFITLRTLIIQLVSLILLFLFVRSEKDIIWYSCSLLFARMGSVIIGFIYSRKYIDWDLKNIGGYKVQHHRPLFFFFIISLASNVYLLSDKIMLGVMCNEETVAIYSASTKLIQILRNVVSTISVVCLPRAVIFFHDNKKKYKELVNDVISIILMMTIPIAVGLCYVAPLVIKFIFGDKYLDATHSLIILAFNCVIALVNGVIAYQVLVPQENENRVFLATSSGCVVNVLLNILFLSKWAENAAAWTTMIAEVVTFLVMYPKAMKEIEIKLQFERVTEFIIATTPFGVLFMLLKSYNVFLGIVILVYFIVCVITYFLLLRMMKNSIIIKLVSMVIKTEEEVIINFEKDN